MGELEKVEANVLAVKTESFTTHTKVRQKILEEEEYLGVLEQIVQRDFFPELTKLKLRSAYLDALECGDIQALRVIQLKLEKATPSSSRQTSSWKPGSVAPATPLGFDDPQPAASGSEGSSQEASSTAVERAEPAAPDLRLDEFLTRNTSEDNASFERLMAVTRDKRREKFAWLFEQREEQNEKSEKRLALPGDQFEQIEQARTQSTQVETWTYEPRNALMYTPDGVEKSIAELIESKSRAVQEIEHANTRFQEAPFDSHSSRTSMKEAIRGHVNTQKAAGRVGADGKLQTGEEDDKVLGYGYVPATPSLTPGAGGESPFMTWGELEGTPLRLDASPAIANTPSFRIPEPPKREQIAHSLVQHASKQHREKRKRAFAAATASFLSPLGRGGTPRSSCTTAERLRLLSPAAQKLVKPSVSRQASNNRSLRSSYSPSPRSTPSPNSSTRSNTPSSTRKRKDRPARIKTPGTGSTGTPGSGRTDVDDGSSITDDLLNLPPT